MMKKLVPGSKKELKAKIEELEEDNRVFKQANLCWLKKAVHDREKIKELEKSIENLKKGVNKLYDNLSKEIDEKQAKIEELELQTSWRDY
jgi:DNA repair exonuclease SbcCD ATPase subunit